MNGPELRGPVPEYFLELFLIFPHKIGSYVLHDSNWRVFFEFLKNCSTKSPYALLTDGSFAYMMVDKD